jgi:hypothetical protein
MGQAIEPLLYGRGTGLSPFAVVVAATFWTWLWGPIGLILSTPLTLCLVVLGRHVARLEFLEVLLGDRPALTPVQSFYQRMLAGDTDEVGDQAEILLKDRSLSSYYDDVVLNGLRLAVIDAERGVLTPVHLARIRVSIQSLIEDLDDREDNQPPAAEAEEPGTRPPTSDDPVAVRRVLCIAGRGPLDEEVSAMLAQLLQKHGLTSYAVPHAATARPAIGTLDVSTVAMVCISSIATTGKPSHLRYQLRRLRRHLRRDVPVLVGFWPEGEEILHDERLRAAVGANFYTSSLREAVETCMTVLHAAAAGEQPPHITAAAA